MIGNWFGTTLFRVSRMTESSFMREVTLSFSVTCFDITK